MLTILENKFYPLTCIALFASGSYLWYNLYCTYKKYKSECEEKLLFQKRHNCVVTYYPQKGIMGWPPHIKRIKPSIQNIDVLFEPFIYFITTAEHSIDVAIMLLGVKSIINALKDTYKKGIQIRIIVNKENSFISELKLLKLAGIKTLLLIPFRSQTKSRCFSGLNLRLYETNTTGLNSIMHYKFIVKDYTETNGYLFTGSLNITNQGFLNNYENAVFSSNHCLVEKFHNIFQDAWEHLHPF